MLFEGEAKEILIGAADVFMYQFDGSTIPEHATIETAAHSVGHCSSGFTVDYKPTKYDISNHHGNVVKSYVTKEEVSAKTGVMSWDLEKLSLLSTGTYSADGAKKVRKLVFTGEGKALKTVLIRAVHVKANGKKLRFTMIGQGGSGFAITFESKEVTVDAELSAIKKVAGFLASFEEELTDDEAAAITPKPDADAGTNANTNTNTNVSGAASAITNNAAEVKRGS